MFIPTTNKSTHYTNSYASSTLPAISEGQYSMQIFDEQNIQNVNFEQFDKEITSLLDQISTPAHPDYYSYQNSSRKDSLYD